MKQGKLPENILDRAVLKKLKRRRREVLTRPAAGADLAAADFNGLAAVSHMNTMCGSAEECGRLAVLSAANGLWAQGADVYGVHMSVTAPRLADEQDIRQFMGFSEAVCAQSDIEIMGGHTQVSDAVNEFVVTVCANGFLEKDKLPDKRRVQAGDDLVMAGFAGLSGTAIMAKRASDALCAKYNPDFIDGAAQFYKFGSVRAAARIADSFGVSAAHDVSSSGIFGALWEFASWSGKGFRVDLKKILLKQETVELCDYFDLNPYRLESSGALLFAAPHGEQLVYLLKKEGIDAAVIGEVTDNHDKTIVNDDEEGFMEPPRGSEMAKVEWRKEK